MPPSGSRTTTAAWASTWSWSTGASPAEHEPESGRRAGARTDRASDRPHVRAGRLRGGACRPPGSDRRTSGRRLALTCARAGSGVARVALKDRTADDAAAVFADARREIARDLRLMAEEGVISAGESPPALSRLRAPCGG